MKKIHLILAVLPLLFGVSCVNESTQDKQAQLCKDLATLNTAVANFTSLSSSSTVDDLRKANDNVEKAFNDVQASVKDVQNAKLDDLQNAKDNLDKAIRNIPAKATLNDARASIADEVTTVQTAQAQLRTGVNCP